MDSPLINRYQVLPIKVVRHCAPSDTHCKGQDNTKWSLEKLWLRMDSYSFVIWLHKTVLKVLFGQRSLEVIVDTNRLKLLTTTFDTERL